MAGLVLLGLVARRATTRTAPDLGPLFTVRKGPLSVTVVGAGTVQSTKYAIIRSAVEGRNTVLWLVDEGRSVTNGELLVELDTSAFVDKRIDQQILVDNSAAGLTQATEKLAIALNERDASVAEAELKLQLARLEETKYQQGEYPQALQESQSKIELAREEVERAVEALNWSGRLADEGYLTRTELQADALALKQKRSGLEAAVTSLNVLTNYTALQQRATLSSNLRQAEFALDRVTRQTRANVIQAESDLRARQLEFERQKTRLEKLETQVRNCRIVAPTNGVVIYTSTMQASSRRWGSEPLQMGVQVGERQDLMQIPLDGGMSVEMSVPESNLAKLALGQRARITVDALPGRVFGGVLGKIGLLPDGRNAWLNPDLKLYNCVLELDAADGLRAGMSCEVELLVAQYEDAIHVPVQCVLQVGQTPTVYVVANGRPVARAVQVGLDNNRVVHVRAGLQPGDQVLMNPPLEAATTGTEPRAGLDGPADTDQPPAAGVAAPTSAPAAHPANARPANGRPEETARAREAGAEPRPGRRARLAAPASEAQP